MPTLPTCLPPAWFRGCCCDPDRGQVSQCQYDIVWHSVTNDAFCDNYQCDGSLWQIHTISFCGAIIDCAGWDRSPESNVSSAPIINSLLASCFHWCVLNWIGCMLHRQRVGPIVTAEVFLAYNFPFKTASSSLHTRAWNEGYLKVREG